MASAQGWEFGATQKWLIVGEANSGKRTLLNVYFDRPVADGSASANVLALPADESCCVRMYSIEFVVVRGFEMDEAIEAEAEAIILCSSARGNCDAFQILPRLREYSPRAKLIVVGTQIDCRTDTAFLNELALDESLGHEPNRRCVSPTDFEALAYRMEADEWMECSAHSIDDVESLVQLVLSTTLGQKLRVVSRPLCQPLPPRPLPIAGGPIRNPPMQKAEELELRRQLQQV